MLSKLFNAVSGVLEFSKTKSKARSLLRGHSQALEELDTLRDTQRQAVTGRAWGQAAPSEERT